MSAEILSLLNEVEDKRQLHAQGQCSLEEYTRAMEALDKERKASKQKESS